MSTMDYLDRQMSRKIMEMLQIAASDMSEKKREIEFGRIIAETRSIVGESSFTPEERQAILTVLEG